MKIIVSSNTAWSIDIFRLNLLIFLHKKGYEINIIAPEDKKYKKKFQSLGFKFFTLPEVTNKISIYKDFKLLLSYLYYFITIKPNIFLGFTIKPNIYGSIITRLMNIKTINNITGLGRVYALENFTTKFINFLYKISLSKSYCIYFQNKHDQNYFIKKKIIHSKNYDLLPGSGVDLKKFRQIKYYPREERNLNFLYCSRLITEKGIIDYLSLAKKIKNKYNNIHFNIIGAYDDSTKKIIEKKILKYSNSKIVNFYGFQEDVRSYIAKCDCLIFPSNYREGFPKIIIETMSIGRPIICNSFPSCDTYISDKNNAIINFENNLEGLINKTEYFINLNDDYKIKLSINARNTAEIFFDDKFIINKYYSLISRL